jgi:hypothetical protein
VTSDFYCFGECCAGAGLVARHALDATLIRTWGVFGGSVCPEGFFAAGPDLLPGSPCTPPTLVPFRPLICAIPGSAASTAPITEFLATFAPLWLPICDTTVNERGAARRNPHCNSTRTGHGKVIRVD